jgi:tuberculosinol/isotuberculosinol synthase
MTISLEAFQTLPVEEVARLVKANGPTVCVFPINGTRRWYLLQSGPESDYMDLATKRHIEIYRMLFRHGIDSLLAPMFGPDLIERGPAYVKMAVEGLTQLTNRPDFLQLYQDCGLRVHFYGDYRKAFATTPHAPVCDLFDEITRQTAANTGGGLYYGVFANNAVGTTAELSMRFHKQYGRAPQEDELLEMYYGETISPANIFIGFDKFCAFDMPLIASENTDLYFTASPSLYLSERQLRAILYDHMFTRRAAEPDYESMTPEAKARLAAFYQTNAETTFGLGDLQDGIWYPHLAGRDTPDRGQ